VLVDYFIVYMSFELISVANKDEFWVDAVPGVERSAPLWLYPDSGQLHFRVTAVSYAGIESGLSPEYVLDTTARLAFIADIDADGVERLYLVPANGSTAPVRAGLLDIEPTSFSWSPNALRLSQVAGDRLYVTSVGTGVTTAMPAYTPVIAHQWSPSGERIAFATGWDGGEWNRLYTVPRYGGTVNSIDVGDSATGSQVPGCWTPDSTALAFLTGNHRELRVAAYDGATSHTISGDLGTQRTVRRFAWSPDGRFLAFTSDLDAVSDFAVYVATRDGETITRRSGPNPGHSVAMNRLAWSPDGSRLAYIADYDTAGVNELYTVSIGNGLPAKVSGPLVTGGSVSSANFAWSPDGVYVAFVAEKDLVGLPELFVAPAGGGGSLKLSGPLVAGGAVRSFRWSPDSSSLAFLAARDDATQDELFVVSSDGRYTSRVSPDLVPGGDVTGYQWSPDGTRLAFLADADVDEQFELYVAQPGGAVQKLSGILPAYADVTQFAWAPLAR